MTVTWPGPGTNSIEFTDDASGSSCILFGTPTTVVQIQNLGTTGFRFFTENLDAACGFLSPGLSHLIGPSATVQIVSSSVDIFTAAMKIAAQDIGPGIYHIRVSIPGPAGPCQFGTERKPTSKAIEILTPILLTAVLSPLGLGELLVFALILEFYNLDVDLLCQRGPDPPAVLTNTSGTQGFDYWLQWFRSIAWNFFCQCTPGSPTPTPPPQPVVVIPPSIPALPGFPCDPGSLCDAIQRLGQQLQALQNQSAITAQLVTLLQRFGVPFAYIRGRRFSTLTATGTQQLDRSIGLLIEVTAFPPSNRELLGVPTYIYDLGWISVLTPDGMLDEMRLTRQATTWLSKLIPSATTVAWGLRDGVTIEISELLAEP